MIVKRPLGVCEYSRGFNFIIMQYIKCDLILTKSSKVDSFSVVPFRGSQFIFRQHIFKWKFLLDKVYGLLPTLKKCTGDILSFDDIQVVFGLNLRSLDNFVVVYFFNKFSSKPIYFVLMSNDFSYKRRLKNLLYSDKVLSFESNLSDYDLKIISMVDIWNRDNIKQMRPSL